MFIILFYILIDFLDPRLVKLFRHCGISFIVEYCESILCWAENCGAIKWESAHRIMYTLQTIFIYKLIL